MKRIAKIASVFITAILTFVSSYKLIPSTSDVGKLLKDIISWLNTYKYFETIFTVIILVLGALVIINMIYEICSEPSKHIFKKGSRRFYNFFAKWYSKPYILSIICDDIEWISDGKKEKILNALIEKSKKNELNLFILKNEKGKKYAKILASNGAKIYEVSEEITSHYSFSCLSFMGNYSAIIVRDKRNDKNQTIKFDEISNNYVTGLINALIKEKNKDEANICK